MSDDDGFESDATSRSNSSDSESELLSSGYSSPDSQEDSDVDEEEDRPIITTTLRFVGLDDCLVNPEHQEASVNVYWDYTIWDLIGIIESMYFKEEQQDTHLYAVYTGWTERHTVQMGRPDLHPDVILISCLNRQLDDAHDEILRHGDIYRINKFQL